jgi:hypothetical protein
MNDRVITFDEHKTLTDRIAALEAALRKIVVCRDDCGIDPWEVARAALENNEKSNG